MLGHIRRQELLWAGDRVGVAVSGGIDSVALLRLLLELRGELGMVLSVVHFNHKLRGAESEADEQFVAGLACEYDLEFHADSDDVAGHAREEGVSLESAARELRYGFFRYLIGEGRESERANVKIPTLSLQKAQGQGWGNRRAGWGNHSRLNKIATGHTLDDQAETVLMRMIRGAGMRGLGGIYPRIRVENDNGEICGEIVRPLLAIRRRELEEYLKDLRQTWREDSSNSETHFTRNRVRNLVVPMLEKEFNPAVAENLSELAEIARGEEDYWQNEVAGWIGTGVASVSRMRLLSGPIAVQRRLIKAIGEQAGIPLEFKHVEEILRFAAEDTGSGRELSLPLGWRVRCEPDEIVFLTPDLREPAEPKNYDYELPVPGMIVIREIGTEIETQRIPAEAVAEYNPDQLLDATSLRGPLTVRNWRPGDRFWPAHTKSPKKIKELLQERHVPLPERRLWPVVACGNEIVWVRGFPSPAKLRAMPGREAIAIIERPLAAAPTA